MREALTAPAGRRLKWVFVAMWLVVLAVGGPYAGKLQDVEKNDASAYLPASAESTAVNTALQGFPTGQAVPGAAVYVDPGGITASDRQLVQQQLDRVRSLPKVTVLPAGQGGATDLVQASADGKALSFSFTVSEPEAKRLETIIGNIRDIVDGRGSLQAYVGGAAGQLVDSVSAFQGIDGVLLLVTGVVVIVLLLVIYRSPVLWLLPILSVGGAIALSESVVYQLAAHAGLVVSGQSGGILTVLVFGAGTDYALLLIARYREELHRHEDRHEAMQAAIRRASPAVLASASTVILGLLCLLAAELNSDRGLGPVGAIGIAAALLAQLTFLPALLVVFGRWVFWPNRIRTDGQTGEGEGLWARLAGRIERRRRPVWVGTSLVLVVMSLGLLDLRLGLPQIDAFVGTPEAVTAQQAIDAHFAAGSGSPTIIIADRSALPQVLATARATPGVDQVAPVSRTAQRVEVVATLADQPDSPAAYATVRQLRDRLHALPGADAIVGGQTATNYDVRQAATHDRWVVMPLVLVVVVVILGLLLRAVVAPLLLALTVVLSFAASLGVSALVFDLIGFAGIDESLPLLAFIFLVALGVDYNIFLMSRVHEEASVRGTRQGTLTGVAVTGGVITSAGVVLAATFSALTVLPLVALVEIGFIVAFGVLLDTLVVRSVLVPALTLEVGPPMWWPSALSRREEPPASGPGGTGSVRVAEGSASR